MLTVKQASALSGVAQGKILRAINSNELKATQDTAGARNRFGRRWLIDVLDLADWLKERRGERLTCPHCGRELLGEDK